jgi:transcriptional regulator with XRE-family HTH domain
MDVKSKIGRRIKELRDKSNLSQKDLAYSSDLDRSYIASVENGQRNISIVNIEKIASALGVSLKEFFDNSLFYDNTKGRPPFQDPN